MFVFDDLLLYTGLLGGTALAGEALNYYVKNKKGKTDKMASGTLTTAESLEGLTGNDGLRISKTVQLKEKTDYEGSLILGPTGAGKTTAFFFPNLLSNNFKGSIIVPDPKGELYQLTSWYQRETCGRETVLFAPLQPEISAKYNLLENCKDTGEVMQLATSLLLNGTLASEISSGKKSGGIEWIDMATPLFTASLLYCKEKGYPLNNIESAFKLLISYSAEDIDNLFSNASEDVKLQYNIYKSVGSAGNTSGGIKVTLSTNLKLFTDKKVCEFTRKNTFKPEKLREKPMCVYIMYPERKSAYLSPFTACFYTQIIDKILDNFNENSLPVTFLFDEFCNVGLLNNMSVNAATVRSRKVSLNICLQSITQLYQLYGEANAKAILNNLKTKVVLPGLNDIATLNYISDLCGRTEIKVSSSSQGDNKTSKTLSNTTKKLMDVDEIRCLNTDELLLIMHNRQPIKDKQNCYYMQDEYTKNVHKVMIPSSKAV